jgi:hypothetical protein
VKDFLTKNSFASPYFYLFIERLIFMEPRFETLDIARFFIAKKQASGAAANSK